MKLSLPLLLLFSVTMLNLKWLMLGNKNVFTVSEQPRACCYLLRAHGTINFTVKTNFKFPQTLTFNLVYAHILMLLRCRDQKYISFLFS